MIKLISTIQKHVIIPQYEHKLTSLEKKGNKFILPEIGKEATCTEARFKKQENESVLVYKFDKAVKDSAGNKIEDPFLFFHPGKARSKSDYLIFYPFVKNNITKLYVIICNMKSGNPSNNSIQLQAGEDLAKFIIATANRFENKDCEIVFLKVLFWNKRIRKGTSKPKKAATSYQVRQGGYIEFDCKNQTCDLQLLCKIN